MTTQPGVRALEHVIVVMLENRSFDHLLGYLDHPDQAFDGMPPGAANPLDPSNPGTGLVPAAVRRRLRLRVDPDHAHQAAMQQLGLHNHAEPTNDGFVASYEDKAVAKGAGGRKARKFARLLEAGIAIGVIATVALQLFGVASLSIPFGVVALVALGVRVRMIGPLDYFPGDGPRIMWGWSPAALPTLSTLAKEFAVCQRWFCSVPGETWPNRQFAHAATSAGTVDIVFRAYRDLTIFEQLDENGRDWRIYFDGPAQVVCYPALWESARRRANWYLIQHLNAHIAGDNLPAYAFVEPNHGYIGRSYSQHPGNNKKITKDFRRADDFVAGIYEALRTHPDVFRKTALVITWDEHGGTYDHVPPEETVEPDDRGSDRFDFRRCGPRVPCIIVSPWIKVGTLDDTVYDHSSIPATLRQHFLPDAPHLSTRAEKAHTFLHLLARDSARHDNLPDLSRHAWRPKATLTWLAVLLGWIRYLIRGDEPIHRDLASAAGQVDAAITVAGEPRPRSLQATGATVQVDIDTAPDRVLPPPPPKPRRIAQRGARKLARAGAEARRSEDA